MNNVKAFAVANDGNAKRIAITYDVINEEGKVINSNMKVNRIITDLSVLDAVKIIGEYSQNIVDEL